jgi:hypothetical protein
VGQNLLPVVPVNARAAWRQHVSRLVDDAPDRHDAVPEVVSAAIARTVPGLGGCGGKLVAAGHPPDGWASANAGPANAGPANAGPAAASPESAYPAEE